MTTGTLVKRRPALRLISLSLTICLAPLVLALSARAQAPASVTLSASPSVILADGRSTTTITATVAGESGHSVTDGTPVRFSTTSGTLSATSVGVSAGIARVTLTSSPLAGTADVTATYLGDGGGASGQVQVEFTSDKDLANSDRGEEDWIRVSSREYLEYSADDQIIDAASPKQGTHFSYRALTIDADAIQVDIQNQIVHARNATVRLRGKEVLEAALLSYNLASHDGNAIVTDAPGQRTVGNMVLSGPDLTAKPESKKNSDFGSDTTYDFADISASRVLVVASDVAVRPGDRIQLKHASIYIDSKKIVSMPYQVMPLNTDQVFGQQVLGYGTDGLFLNVPYYFSVSPRNTGTFYLRSPAASLQNGTWDTGRTGLSLDMDDAYGDPSGSSHGEFQLLGLTNGAWGAQWNHSQNFGADTKGYFYLDAPEHKSLFASANLTHEFPHLSFSLNTSDSQNPTVDGFSSESRSVNAYLQTDPHRVLGTTRMGLNVVGMLTDSDSQSFIHEPNGLSSDNTVDTRGAGLRLFTPTVNIDRNTHLTDSLDLEQDYNSITHVSALVSTANLGASERLGPTTSANLSYAYTHNPFLAQPNLAVLPNAAALLILNPVDKHDFTFSFLTGPARGLWSLSISSTYELPTNDQSFSTALNYRLSPVWHVGVTQFLDRIGIYSYQDVELSLARRIGTRDIVVYWDTLEHRFRFNMEAASF